MSSPPNEPVTFKSLNTKEQETVIKFKQASLVLQAVFEADPQIRKEFNGFIAAKLAKSGTDEELTFKEIFEAKPLKLAGVKSDFLSRFKDVFAGTFISGKYPERESFATSKFVSVQEVAEYYDVKSLSNTALLSGSPIPSADENGVPYMIYFPYSENWNPQATSNYAITYHPLTNNDVNGGRYFSSTGTYLNDVTVNDDYAYKTPTYVVTYDDGLTYDDINSGKYKIESSVYNVELTGDDYEPIILTVGEPITPNPSPCNTALWVKDGRWLKIRNGYGLFEGKIEFAVAVSKDVKEVTVPTQLVGSDPTSTIELGAHAWGYRKVKRKDVWTMRRDDNAFVKHSLKVGPWCTNQPDKMLYIYEYDKPNGFSANSKEWSGVVDGAIGLIADSALRKKLQALGIPATVKAVLEGSAWSRIEYYGIIGSNEVITNQRKPVTAFYPSLLNGFRPHGSYETNVTLSVE